MSSPERAGDFLSKAEHLMAERGKEYDQDGGERSMRKAVAAFNNITDHSLSEADGWLLLQVLKDVRQWQNPLRFHRDSAEDCIAYAALKAEALCSADGATIKASDIRLEPFALHVRDEADGVVFAPEDYGIRKRPRPADGPTHPKEDKRRG